MVKKGLTLIELLIVIVILGILAALITGSFFTSLKKGRDARRKGDLEQIQRALEMYYEDKRSYPTFNIFATAGYQLCETNILSSCGSQKVYMIKIPDDPLSSNNYVYSQTGSTYKLYSCIENSQDQGSGVKQAGYGVSCGSGVCNPCKYGISSPNVNP